MKNLYIAYGMVVFDDKENEASIPDLDPIFEAICFKVCYSVYLLKLLQLEDSTCLLVLFKCTKIYAFKAIFLRPYDVLII